MRRIAKALVALLSFPFISDGQILKGGPISFVGGPISSAYSALPFNTLNLTYNTFDPAKISGVQCVDITTGTRSGTPPCNTSPYNYAVTGFQGGDVVNGYMIYPPWTVPPSASNSFSVLNTYLTVYKGTHGTGDFTLASNWVIHDMELDGTYPSGPCPNIGSITAYCPGGYNSGVIVGNIYYLVSGYDNKLPVYVRIDVGGTAGSDGTPFSNSTNYQYMNGNVAFPSSGAIGAATAFFDGRYVNYVPSITQRWVRYDTTGTFTVAGSWSGLQISTCSLTSDSWLGGAADGHRYIYGFPGTGAPAATHMIRYDTTLAFNCTSGAFSVLDLTQLNQTGQPKATGIAATAQNIALMKGFAGGIVAVDGTCTGPSTCSSGTAWLYIIPWETAKGGGFTGPQTLGFITARVACGTYSGGTFTAAGAAGSPLPDIFSSSAVYEIADMSSLIGNPAFTANLWNPNPGGSFTSGQLSGQPTIAGYQLGWFNWMTNRAIYNVSDGYFEVEFDASRHIWDVTGTYVGLADYAYMSDNNYGGPIVLGTAGNTTIYPSSPTPTGGKFLIQIGGM